MVQTFSLYDTVTGIVTSVKSGMTEQDMQLTLTNIGSSKRSFIEGHHEPNKTYVKNDKVHQLPEKSDSWLIWNLQTEQWEDNRSSVEVFEQLTQKRKTANLTRRELCLELVRRNILTQSDAITASKGDWPSSLQPFWDQINALDPLVATELLIEWGGSNTINRLDPNILTIASLLVIDESTLDVIFKVNV